MMVDNIMPSMQVMVKRWLNIALFACTYGLSPQCALIRALELGKT